MGSLGSDYRPRHLDPDYVFELINSRRPDDLFQYLDTIPGASGDAHCLKVRHAAIMSMQPRSSGDEDSWILHCARFARFEATNSRLCAPQMARNPPNLTSDAGHYMQRPNSSSYSRNMLATHEPDSSELRHSASLNQLSASSSQTPAATFPPKQANSNVDYRHATMVNQLFASSSQIPAATFPPKQANSNVDYRHVTTVNQLSTSGLRTPAATFPPMHGNSNDVLLSASSSRIPAAMFPPTQANSNVDYRHAAMLNQSSAPSSMIPAATFPPMHEYSNDVLRHGTMHTQLSASRSRIHTATFPPLQANSNGAQAFAEQSPGRPVSEQMAPQELMQNIISPQELQQNNQGTPAVGVQSLCHSGSEQFTQQMLMQNREVLPPTVAIKGKKTSEVDELNTRILRLNVASLVAQDGTRSAVGVLIRDGSTAKFITARSFAPIMRTEPDLLFAAACCEGIKIALSYQPTTILLESHLIYLLDGLCASQNKPPDVEQLNELLSLKTIHFMAQRISEESNQAARQLALYALHKKVSNMVFKDPPDWLSTFL
ncbi:hypothetical protein BRADI_2g27950v3 [Brachypodium distachyon]|uniref:Uncharacterized protein n=1 Tax=Brachypodium distachyon TaxID=15368 RepID=A0A2K2DB18_BRADI|nr:hypothetical protein BRADI_2g27950v3 [Brachypodium distachyon]